jgi:RNA polymerase sigma-70 factor (ECF subfamily)
VCAVDGREGGADLAAEFDAFYAVSATRIVRQMVLLTGDTAEAEDVTQEAFERAWTRWSLVRDAASPEAWVRTVARRLAVSRWRRIRNATVAWRRHGPATEPPELGADHVVLIAALAALPEAQRVAIVLHHLADLPVAQVAQETGLSVSAVKQQLVRGRAALADSLTDGAALGSGEPALARREEER